MHIVRIQTMLRMAVPFNETGWYYWTSQYYADLDNPPVDNNSLYWISVFIEEVYSEAVQANWVRVLDPPDSEIVTFSGSRFDQPGLYPIESGYSPHDTVLMRWLIGDSKVGYSRLRLPVQADDQIDGVLHPDLVSHVEDRANDLLLHAKVTSHVGEPIESFRVDPLVRGWQFRHGTRRRNRVVFPQT